MNRSAGLTIGLAKDAEPAEKYAAEELQKYVDRLYGFTPEIGANLHVQRTGAIVLIGHRAVESYSVDLAKEIDWSSLSPDGFVLKAVQTNPEILVVVGGSGRGTLFGVYELLEHWGVRFILSGDVLPETPEPFDLTGFDERVEPAYPIRAMRPMANLPEGAAAWDLSDFTGFIDQMARLKFNTFTFVILESGPWLDYEFRGEKRPAGDIFYGYRFPIDEDFIGKELYAGQSEFYSPILANARDDEDRKRLGIELVRAIIRHCHTRGLMTLLTFTLLEPPTAFKHRFNEWASVPLPDPKTFEGATFFATPAEEFGINPQYAAWMNVLDPSVRELIAHRLKILINTYPEADFFHFWVSEHRASVVDCRKIFQELDEKYRLAPEFDWDRALEDFGSSPFARERYQNQMKGDLLFLYVLDKILNEEKLLEQTARPHAKIGIAGVMPQLAPLVTRILPPDATFVQFLDYGAHGPAEQIERIIPLLKAGIPTTLEIGVHDDNNMYFPQANVESLERIIKATASLSMQGYVAALWQVPQSDIGASYLGRASWDPNLTASAFYEDLLPRLVGAAAAEDFERACRLVEKVDRQIRKGITYGYAFLLSAHLIQSFIQNGVDRNAISQIRPQFQLALEHFLSARIKASEDGRSCLDFWIRRTQFAVQWLDLACACDDLGKILQNGLSPGTNLTVKQRQAALTTLDSLLSRSRQVIELITGDVRHIGDLGQIANLNQHARHYFDELRQEIANRRSQ
jgi:hypothetical protein